jgi:hypothetical protein
VFAAIYITVKLRLLRVLVLNDGEAALAIMAHALNQFMFLALFHPGMFRVAGYFRQHGRLGGVAG